MYEQLKDYVMIEMEKRKRFLCRDDEDIDTYSKEERDRFLFESGQYDAYKDVLAQCKIADWEDEDSDDEDWKNPHHNPYLLEGQELGRTEERARTP